ncbi:MAG: DUF3267 domain-containing protein [Clostridiaceae bacterium]
MYNIKFMGKYKNESQILTGNLPKQAIQYNEPSKLTDIFLMGTLISLPMIIILFALVFVKIEIWNIQFKNINVPNLLMSTITACILSLVLLVIHEFLHALAYPKNHIKEIWFKPNELAAFVYCNGQVSKGKFIWISLCPNIILGFIPYALWILGIFDFNFFMRNSPFLYRMEMNSILFS